MFHVSWRSGLIQFKIEGRMKSAEYVGTVVAAYRQLIDNCAGDKVTGFSQVQGYAPSRFRPQKDKLFYGGRES